MTEPVYLIKEKALKDLKVANSVMEKIKATMRDDLNLYYIAQEYIENEELQHVYMHTVCTEDEAQEELKKIKLEIIKQVKNVKEEDLRDGWYEKIDNIHGSYKVNLKKIDWENN